MSDVLTIERLGHLGDGIAPGPVYVKGVLPGEEVTGEITGNVLKAPRIVTPSPDRVSPPCRHAKSCGGCQLQHASDPFVLAWKREVVQAALAAHGVEAEVLPPLTSPHQSRRRASFAARRTKKGALAGFHQKASDVVVSVPECQLVRPAISAALPMVEELAVIGTSRKAELSVLVTETRTGLDVAVTGGKPVTSELRLALAQVAETFDLARIAWDDEVLTRRAPVLRMGHADLTPPPGAFLQATTEGEAALQTLVAKAVDGATRVADLFSGCGTFALPLAAHAEVHAVESAAPMLAALDQSWRTAKGLKRITHETRDLYRNPLLPEELGRFDAVVLDPPRAGAQAQVEQIAQAAVPRLAYVSCSPTSFARDAARLISAGYRLGPVQVVDQFRWSTHVELAAQLTFEG